MTLIDRISHDLKNNSKYEEMQWSGGYPVPEIEYLSEEERNKIYSDFQKMFISLEEDFSEFIKKTNEERIKTIKLSGTTYIG